MGYKRVIGLDIGTEYLKAVELEKGEEGLRIVKSESLKLPLNVEEERIADELKLLWMRGNFSRREVVTNLQLPDVMVKKVITERDLSPERIEWEIKNYLPFDSSSIVIDTYITKPSIPPNYQEMVLVATPKDRVEKRVKLLRQAGLSPSSIIPSSIALSNLLEFTYPELREAIIIHIGFRSILFIAYEDKRPVLVHLLSLGLKDISSEVQDTLKVDSRRLSSEIEDSYSFLPEFPKKAKVFLSGGGALIPDIVKDTEILSFKNLSPLYNVALGLGIGALYA